MIEDLTMLATLPVCADEAAATAQAEADKAAAGETMPPGKEKNDDKDDTVAERVARRGQDPPEHERTGEEDRG